MSFYSMLILLSIFLLSDVAVCEKDDEKISESERILMKLQSENKPKANKAFQLIFPGTRWCGDGDKANSKDELGYFNGTDVCCREHDFCSDTITSGQSKHGLSNEASFTRLDCSCDAKFYKCLSSLCSPAAASIGITYFDILRPSCFTYDHPVTCTKEESNRLFGKRCVVEKVELTKPKTWHWRETKKFDLSETSQRLKECFKNVTVKKLNDAAFSKSIEAILTLHKICAKLDPNSWYAYFCPKKFT